MPAPTPRCERCARAPIARCGRCSAGSCADHAPARGARCALCEAEYAEGKRARSAVKHMFAPAAFVFAGGAAFGALLPLVAILPAFVGAVAVATASTVIGVLAAAGTAGLVDGAARAQFLREHARALPEARARVVHHRALPPPRGR